MADVQATFGGTEIQLLGAGSFGDTWRVGNQAVKIIVDDEVDVRRIEREVSAGRIEHSNVVRLMEVREIDVAGATRTALIFEHVPGCDLATAVLSDGPTPRRPLRRLAMGIFAGLAAAHEQRVIHRDVKPQNVQLRDGDASDPVILDLGLAHIADLSSLTVYPAAIGTRAYMPPEILRGEHAVRRSDVYSAAVTIAIAATGRHPWMEDEETISNTELIARIAEIEPALDIEDDLLRELLVQALRRQAYRRPAATQLSRQLAGGT